MQKRIVLAIVISVLLGWLMPVVAQTDSLQALLKTAPADTQRVKILNKLSYALNYSNAPLARQYSREAITLSTALPYPEGKAGAFRNLAIIYKNFGKYDSAGVFCDSAEVYYQSLQDSIGLAGVYNTHGTIEYYRANFQEALQWYKKAYKLYHRHGYPGRSATLLNNIGLAYSEMSNYEGALEYYFKALKLHEKEKNKHGRAMTYSNIGIIYFNRGNIDKAMDFYRKSLALRKELKDDFGIASCYSNMGNLLGAKGKHQAARKHYYRALDIYTRKKDINHEAITYTQLGQSLFTEEKFAEAIRYYKKAELIGRKTGNLQSLGYVNLDMAIALLKLGRYDKVRPRLDESHRIFERIGDKNMLSYVYQGYAEYYETIGDYRNALNFQRKYTTLHDSLLTQKSSKRISEAELLYETQKKENELKLLTNEKRLQELQLAKQKRDKQLLFFIAGLILLFAAFLVWRILSKIQMNRLLNDKNRQLSENTEQIARQKEKIQEQVVRLRELDETKSRFFANISHEFRTPLTLIKGPVTDTLKESGEVISQKTRTQLKLALRNANHLKRLIDQLLDLSRLQAGKLILKASRQDLVPFLRRVTRSFESAIPPGKEITIRFNAPNESVFLYFDTEKLESVFYNLISNALKSIKKEGLVEVTITKDAEHNTTAEASGSFVRVTVCDNGKGIREEDLPHIFDRFFRSANSGLPQEESTGIGLEITRELVELHGGRIQAESTFGKGTLFTLDLPVGKEHLLPEEITGGEAGKEQSAESLSAAVPLSETATYSPDTDEERPLILVVEDHADMRKYIAEHLANKFKVVEATNGYEGLEKTSNQQPDLIISDMMMPEMDGKVLMEKLKSNEATNDIPVIILTARAADSDRLIGYKAKADMYLTKPFDPDELLLHVTNLLEKKRLLAKKYGKKVFTLDFGDEKLLPADKAFLQKLSDCVTQNLSDPGLNIKTLEEHVFLSERQLRRKLKRLTGLSPVEFIRHIRLNRAKELLEKKIYLTVAEAALAVGFTNPPYFTRLFRKAFNRVPHEILNEEA